MELCPLHSKFLAVKSILQDNRNATILEKFHLLNKSNDFHSFEVKIHSEKSENCHSFSKNEIFSSFF